MADSRGFGPERGDASAMRCANFTGTLNDKFADASEISGPLPLAIGSTNEGATKEAGEPAHAGNLGGASVWWRWTVPTAGTAVVDTIGSSFDTVLAVYRGNSLTTLTQVAANDDSGSLQSRVSFDAQSGEQFWIAVDGYNAATGGLTLNVEVGTPATVFASMINASPTDATNCRIALLNTLPSTFNYRTTDPATNVPDGGPANRLLAIPAGGLQTFLLEFIPGLAFNTVDLQFSYVCDEAGPATVVSGLNTILLSASNGPTADLVALASTATGQATVLAAPGTPGAFAVASANVGVADTITIAPSAANPALPVTLTICETDPATAACLATPASSVTTTIAGNATPTFSIFVSTTSAIDFAPAQNRIRVVFTDGTGNSKGSTSVAVATSLP